MSVLFACYIYTQSCHLSQPRPYGEQSIIWIYVSLSSLICFIIFMARYYEWFKGNPICLLKLYGCSWISVASLNKQSLKLVILASTMVSLKFIWFFTLMLRSVTADLSGWYSCVCRAWSLHLFLKAWLICPTYIFLHSHRIHYMSGILIPGSFFTFTNWFPISSSTFTGFRTELPLDQWKMTLALGSQVCIITCVNAARSVLDRQAVSLRWGVIYIPQT